MFSLQAGMSHRRLITLCAHFRFRWTPVWSSMGIPLPRASPFSLSTSSFLVLPATRQWKVNIPSLSHPGQERRGAGFSFPISPWWEDGEDLMNRSQRFSQGCARGKNRSTHPSAPADSLRRCCWVSRHGRCWRGAGASLVAP